MFSSRSHVVAAQPGFHLGLGGGGLAHLILRLFIWHEIFRLFRYLWRIPTFGPFIVAALGIILIGLLVWRNAHGPVRLSHRRRGGPTSGPDGSGGPGPRDW